MVQQKPVGLVVAFYCKITGLRTTFGNFSASSTESLDSIFTRLQKIVSRLAILGVVIAQEDLNSKFLSSLPPEWNTHVVVWMNKPEVETMSIDDLYNNFKIVEQKVKKFVGASSGAQNLAFMTASSTSSTNDANTASPQVSTSSPNVNTASPQVSTASFSDNDVYAFMVENPNGSNLLHQDLEQIHEDDLEAMDLKWQLSLLSMRAKRYYQRIGKKIFINANDTAGYDKSKVECFNCQSMGHFARECRAPRSKEEEQVHTNMALMAFSDSELNQTEFTTATYKRGLATLEEQLITYRKNEFAKVKQEKEGIEFKIEKFDNALKSLDKLLGSQITNKSKNGLGYNDVPPPYPLIYNRPKKLDLSYSGLDEFKDPEFKNDSKENSDDSLVKEQVSKDTSSFVESSFIVNKETVFLVDKKIEFSKSKNHEKPVKKSDRQKQLILLGQKLVNTVRPHSAVVNAVRVNKANVVKASACWVWRPTKLDSKKPQQDDTRFIDSGCSRHMTRNIAYVTLPNWVAAEYGSGACYFSDQ
ncbi:putative ribonuclease H-like domain-containing protein [Tanacetum coccineum]